MALTHQKLIVYEKALNVLADVMRITARFYRMALRSAAECHAGCDVMVRVNVTTADMVVAAQSELNEIVPMLVALCKRHSA